MAKLNGSKWIRPEKRARIYKRDGHCCMYCGESIYENTEMILTLDHVVPRELGGGNESGNLVTACLHCNSSKQHKTTREFIAVFADRGVNPDNVRSRLTNARRRKLPK